MYNRTEEDNGKDSTSINKTISKEYDIQTAEAQVRDFDAIVEKLNYNVSRRTKG